MSMCLDDLDDDALEDAATELRREFYLICNGEEPPAYPPLPMDQELFERLSMAVVRGLRRHQD